MKIFGSRALDGVFFKMDRKGKVKMTIRVLPLMAGILISSTSLADSPYRVAPTTSGKYVGVNYMIICAQGMPIVAINRDPGPNGGPQGQLGSWGHGYVPYIPPPGQPNPCDGVSNPPSR